MCGIAGIFNQQINQDELKSAAKKMALAISHRGPDDYGLWSDEASNLVISHQRLAIIDLTEAGHQPMVSNSSRYVIAFNGEIYNHLELRKTYLKNYAWETSSDTETILALFENFGIESIFSVANRNFDQ